MALPEKTKKSTAGRRRTVPTQKQKIAVHEWNAKIEVWFSLLDFILIRIVLSGLLIYEVSNYVSMKMH